MKLCSPLVAAALLVRSTVYGSFGVSCMGLTFAKLPEIGLGDDGYIAITEQGEFLTSVSAATANLDLCLFGILGFGLIQILPLLVGSSFGFLESRISHRPENVEYPEIPDSSFDPTAYTSDPAAAVEYPDQNIRRLDDEVNNLNYVEDSHYEFQSPQKDDGVSVKGLVIAPDSQLGGIEVRPILHYDEGWTGHLGAHQQQHHSQQQQQLQQQQQQQQQQPQQHHQQFYFDSGPVRYTEIVNGQKPYNPPQEYQEEQQQPNIGGFDTGVQRGVVYPHHINENIVPGYSQAQPEYRPSQLQYSLDQPEYNLDQPEYNLDQPEYNLDQPENTAGYNNEQPGAVQQFIESAKKRFDGEVPPHSTSSSGTLVDNQGFLVQKQANFPPVIKQQESSVIQQGAVSPPLKDVLAVYPVNKQKSARPVYAETSSDTFGNFLEDTWGSAYPGTPTQNGDNDADFSENQGFGGLLINQDYQDIDYTSGDMVSYHISLDHSRKKKK